MSYLESFVQVLIINLTILFTLTYLYVIVAKQVANLSPIIRSTVFGLLFSAIAITSMHIAYAEPAGTLVDLRSVVIALAAPFGGIWAGLLSGLIAVFYRLSLGGIGSWAGAFSIAASCIFGIAFRYWKKDPAQFNLSNFLITGLYISAFTILGAYLIIEREIAIVLIKRLAIPATISFTIASLLLGYFLRHQYLSLTAQERLQQSERNYRLLVENQTDLVTKVDTNGRFLYASPSYCELFGKKEEELLGAEFAPLIHEDEQVPMHKAMEDLYRPPYKCYVEQRAMTEDGWRWLGWEYKAVLNEDNDVIANTGLGRDINDKKEYEISIVEANRRFRNLTELLPTVVFEMDLNNILTFVNTRASELFGYSAEELLDNFPGFSLLDGSVQEQAKHNLKKRSEGKELGAVEYLGVKKDGTTFPMLLHTAPILKEDRFVGTRGVAIDISETKRLQEQQFRAERLETAGTIAGQVAHDFNNILAPMMAYPDLIREELPKHHPSHEYLDQIETAAQKIADINQQLLTLGRRGHYNQNVLNLNKIIHQAVREITPLSESVTCSTDLDSDLMNIFGGGSQIHRVITNLLCNAVDALQGTGQINIKTENYYADVVSGAYGRIPKGEYVKLTISDTGCGISEDIVGKILDPFFTTKTSDKRRGSGLGMSIVDSVIKDHNGFLDLETMPDKGTSFYIYFPIIRKSLEKDDSDEVPEGHETILVVDDDHTQRNVSIQLLKKMGYVINSVESGEEAIELLREKPHDLVVLDMIMPGGIDGTETYQRILEIVPNQKAIIVSGFSETDRVQAALESGAGVFVKKPLTKAIIASAVRTELDRETQSPTF